MIWTVVRTVLIIVANKFRNNLAGDSQMTFGHEFACLRRPARDLFPAMKELPHTYSCFCCGEANAAGLRLRLETDGNIVQTYFRFKPEHTGFKAVVHGGLTATVLDEVMAWACAVGAGKFAFSAELTVRYLKPIAPGITLTATAELVANRKNKIFETKAALHDPSGVILAEATGKYLPVSAEALPQMATDLVGHADWLLKSRD